MADGRPRSRPFRRDRAGPAAGGSAPRRGRGAERRGWGRPRAPPTCPRPGPRPRPPPPGRPRRGRRPPARRHPRRPASRPAPGSTGRSARVASTWACASRPGCGPVSRSGSSSCHDAPASVSWSTASRAAQATPSKAARARPATAGAGPQAGEHGAAAAGDARHEHRRVVDWARTEGEGAQVVGVQVEQVADDRDQRGAARRGGDGEVTPGGVGAAPHAAGGVGDRRGEAGQHGGRRAERHRHAARARARGPGRPPSAPPCPARRRADHGARAARTPVPSASRPGCRDPRTSGRRDAPSASRQPSSASTSGIHASADGDHAPVREALPRSVTGAARPAGR